MTTRPVNLVRALPTDKSAARGRMQAARGLRMNRTEQRFASEVLVGDDIASWHFAAIKLRLADKTHYTPDFVVWLRDGSIDVYEVKGSWRAPHQEDSRVKLKVAAELFPQFAFFAATPRKAGGWDIEEIPCRR